MSRPEDELAPEDVERLKPVITRLQAVPAEAWDGVEPPPLRLPEPVRPARRRLVLRPAVAALCALALLAAGIGVGAWLDRDPAPASSWRCDRSATSTPQRTGR